MTAKDILTVVAAMVLSIAFLFLRPQHLTCPNGWWLPEGVRREGNFACHRAPVGDDVRLPNGHTEDHSVAPPGVIYTRVYCEPNAIPTIVDTSQVSCTYAN